MRLWIHGAAAAAFLLTALPARADESVNDAALTLADSARELGQAGDELAAPADGLAVAAEALAGQAFRREGEGLKPYFRAVDASYFRVDWLLRRHENDAAVQDAWARVQFDYDRLQRYRP